MIGDAVHTAILEPELFPLRYVSAPELDLRTKDGKKILSDFEKKNLTLARLVLKKEEFEAIQLMRDSALAYPLVAELLENGEPELSIFYRTEKGTLLKIRPDWLGLYSGVPFILDVKTTDDVHDFGKSVDKFGYHLQAAFYRIIAQKVFNLDIDFLFCAIGKRPECGRYPVQLGMLDEEDSEEGEIQVNGVINALEKGGETQAFAMISRPFWAKQADRKRREALMLEGGVA
ncbi:Exodeoxyribonuclease 8 (plasmid) [Arsenophonus nasoniae]|uniref:Exodeoxyribonuclease 8 n=1 Tax=Arsenophonus nasoniae TaxID=638 RepID=A0A4P7L155_9GAMM|nr:Exodeoxyribonuclease 8 [Arsenophonus nasoniae]